MSQCKGRVARSDVRMRRMKMIGERAEPEKLGLNE